uniref:MARVEL domain-containing protein n=1 Tax=Haemonchus contortus TaxID=6289 RepID=A0A7I5ECY0_HAECO
MSDTDEEIMSESPKRVDEILENKFVYHSRRTELSATTEGCFVIIFVFFGLIELISFGEQICGLSLLCGAFMFFCLFLEYHLAVAFNCWPLLICHAAQAGGICISLFALLVCTLLVSHPSQITVIQFRVTMMLTIAVAMIIMVLLATYAASSLTRARELWAFDACHTDHLRRLLIEALEALGDYRRENPKKER